MLFQLIAHRFPHAPDAAMDATTTPWRRDVISEASSVKNTFSSWDNCMAQSYCKYPVIVAIVIGCLIVFSVLWCVIRCCCCGLSCCCGCLSCFNACCPGPRGGKSKKYADPPPPLQYRNQYQSPPTTYNDGPKFATFDAPSKGGNDDALPEMPSWEKATSRRVENPDADLEMGDLAPPGNHAGGSSYAPSSTGSGMGGYRGTESTASFGAAGSGYGAGAAAPIGAAAVGAAAGAGAGYAYGQGRQQRRQDPYGAGQGQGQGPYGPGTPTGGMYTSNRAGPPAGPGYGYGNMGGRGGGGYPPSPQGQSGPGAGYRSPPPVAGTNPAAYNAGYASPTNIQPTNVYGTSYSNPDQLPHSTSSHNLMSDHNDQYQQQPQQPYHSNSYTSASPTSPHQDPSNYFPAENQAPEPSQYNAYSNSHEQQGSGRPPSTLMAGRKPAPGTWRET